MDINNALATIKNAGDKKKALQIEQRKNLAKYLTANLNKINSMSKRIDDVITMALAIVEAGLQKDYQLYVSTKFDEPAGIYADRWYHHVGLFTGKNNEHFRDKAALMTGAGGFFGEWDLVYEMGVGVYYHNTNTGKISDWEYVLWPSENFIKQFEKFEQYVISFVENLHVNDK